MEAGKTPIPSFFNLTKRKSARDSEIKKHDTEIASLNAELANNQQEVRKQRKQKIERFKSDAVKERDVIDSILTLYKELADPNKAKIEFRVYMTVEGTEVDLLRSKDFPKPVAKAIESSKS